MTWPTRSTVRRAPRRGGARDCFEATNYRRRLAAIEDAQREGRVTKTLTPVQILALIESLVVGWIGTTMAIQAEGDAELERARDAHRKALTEGLRRMLTTA